MNNMHKEEKMLEIDAMMAQFEVEELEGRLEFASCHWAQETGEGHEVDGNIFNCHW